jgi:hypothetical protein
MLRALRQHPPGLASEDPARRATFVSALEQSEQFFRAAASTGPQTRALLLFYGIAQSGRAVRAAQQQDGNWSRAGNHGLTVVGSSTGGNFSDALVSDQKRKPSDAFGWVALTLGRSSLPQPYRVGDLARLLFPYARFPLAGQDPTHPVLKLSAIRDVGLPLGRVDGAGLRADLTVPASTWEMQLPDVSDRTTADYERYKAHIRGQLAHYPTLAEAELHEPVSGYFQLASDSDKLRKLALVWPDLEPWDGVQDAVLHAFSDQNRSNVTIWPALDSEVSGASANALATHPYLLWWAVLYVAAHYVRYEPEHWARLVDVDASPEAVALEELGDVALGTLPELIHRVLVRTEPQ